MTTDLRCEAKKHGVLDEGVVEVKCDSRFCGARQGVIVLHRFSTADGRLVNTVRFSEPPNPKQKVRK